MFQTLIMASMHDSPLTNGAKAAFIEIMKSTLFWPVTALVTAVLIWGIVPSMIRSLALATGPSDSVFIRMWANAICSLPLLFFSGWRIERSDWLRMVFLGCACNFGYYLGSIYGFANLSAGAGGMLYATNPLMIVGLAVALGQEKLSLPVILGMAISFAGTVYLFSGGLGGGGGNPVFGGLVMLGACFSWALYATFVKPMVRKYGPLRVTLYTTMLPAIPATLFLNAGTASIFTHLSVRSLWELGLMAAVGTIFSVNLWNYAAIHLKPSSTGASLYLIPPGVALFGYVVLQETTGPQTLIGGFIIMIGVAVAEFGKSFTALKARTT